LTLIRSILIDFDRPRGRAWSSVQKIFNIPVQLRRTAVTQRGRMRRAVFVFELFRRPNAADEKILISSGFLALSTTRVPIFSNITYAREASPVFRSIM
jgi:hypothetical protein